MQLWVHGLEEAEALTFLLCGDKKKTCKKWKLALYLKCTNEHLSIAWNYNPTGPK
jgi:hypothetical protein